MTEKFADTDSPTSSRDYGRVSPFVRLVQDYSVMLFVLSNTHQENPTTSHIRWTHWIPQAQRMSGQRGLSVTCPGPQICPICISNQKLKNAYGNKFRQHKEYINTSKRFLTNVFDITDVKKCVCGAIYFPVEDGGFIETCADEVCDTDLQGLKPEPLNRIRVLEGSRTLFDHFNKFQKSILDENDEPIDLREYPIKFSVSGSGRQKTITPVPMLQLMSKYNRPTEEDFTLSDGTVQESYDLVKLTAPFAPDELNHLMEGGSVGDIFAAREAVATEMLEEEEIPF